MPDDPVSQAPTEKQAALPPPGKLRRVLRMLAWGVVAFSLALTLAAALLATLAAHMQVNAEQLRHWQQMASQVRHWGAFIQCLAVAAVVLWWRAIVALGLRKGVVKPHELQQVIGLRGKVMAFGVAYLLLVPIGPATLWRYLAP